MAKFNPEQFADEYEIAMPSTQVQPTEDTAPTTDQGGFDPYAFADQYTIPSAAGQADVSAPSAFPEQEETRVRNLPEFSIFNGKIPVKDSVSMATQLMGATNPADIATVVNYYMPDANAEISDDGNVVLTIDGKKQVYDSAGLSSRELMTYAPDIIAGGAEVAASFYLPVLQATWIRRAGMSALSSAAASQIRESIKQLSGVAEFSPGEVGKEAAVGALASTAIDAAAGTGKFMFGASKNVGKKVYREQILNETPEQKAARLKDEYTTTKSIDPSKAFLLKDAAKAANDFAKSDLGKFAEKHKIPFTLIDVLGGGQKFTSKSLTYDNQKRLADVAAQDTALAKTTQDLLGVAKSYEELTVGGKLKAYAAQKVKKFDKEMTDLADNLYPDVFKNFKAKQKIALTDLFKKVGDDEMVQTGEVDLGGVIDAVNAAKAVTPSASGVHKDMASVMKSLSIDDAKELPGSGKYERKFYVTIEDLEKGVSSKSRLMSDREVKAVMDKHAKMSKDQTNRFKITPVEMSESESIIEDAIRRNPAIGDTKDMVRVTINDTAGDEGAKTYSLTKQQYAYAQLKLDDVNSEFTQFPKFISKITPEPEIKDFVNNVKSIMATGEPAEPSDIVTFTITDATERKKASMKLSGERAAEAEEIVAEQTEAFPTTEKYILSNKKPSDIAAYIKEAKDMAKTDNVKLTTYDKSGKVSKTIVIPKSELDTFTKAIQSKIDRFKVNAEEGVSDNERLMSSLGLNIPTSHDAIFLENDLQKLHHARLMLREMIDGKSGVIIGDTQKRYLGKVNDALTAAMTNASPEYADAARRYASASDALNDLKSHNYLYSRFAESSNLNVAEKANEIIEGASDEAFDHIQFMLKDMSPTATDELAKEYITKSMQSVGQFGDARFTPMVLDTLFLNEKKAGRIKALLNDESRANYEKLQQAFKMATNYRGASAGQTPLMSKMSTMDKGLVARLAVNIGQAGTPNVYGQTNIAERLFDMISGDKEAKSINALQEVLFTPKYQDAMAKINKIDTSKELGRYAAAMSALVKRVAQASTRSTPRDDDREQKINAQAEKTKLQKLSSGL